MKAVLLDFPPLEVEQQRDLGATIVVGGEPFPTSHSLDVALPEDPPESMQVLLAHWKAMHIKDSS